MAVHDFFLWKDELSQDKLKKLHPRPYRNEMVEVKFTRSVNTLSYKTSFDSPFYVTNFLKANC